MSIKSLNSETKNNPYLKAEEIDVIQARRDHDNNFHDSKLTNLDKIAFNRNLLLDD